MRLQLVLSKNLRSNDCTSSLLSQRCNLVRVMNGAPQSANVRLWRFPLPIAETSTNGAYQQGARARMCEHELSSYLQLQRAGTYNHYLGSLRLNVIVSRY